MKIGIVGSRNLIISNLKKYLPDNITEIVSGGAKGVDTSAREYAKRNNIKITEFFPEYDKKSHREIAQGTVLCVIILSPMFCKCFRTFIGTISKIVVKY